MRGYLCGIIFFGDAQTAIVTILIGLSVILYFKGQEKSEQRKIAGYCVGLAILVAFIGEIYERRDLSSRCRGGDYDACDTLDIKDYEDQIRNESYR